METQDEIGEYVAERLDQKYVEATGGHVAEAIRAGTPLEVNYQPGDGTSYGLVFVPLDQLECAPGRLAPMRGETGLVQWEARFPFGVSRSRGACLVCWANHGAVGLDLACGGYVGGYLDGLFGGGIASGFALQALLDSVTEHLSEEAEAA